MAVEFVVLVDVYVVVVDVQVDDVVVVDVLVDDVDVVVVGDGVLVEENHVLPALKII